jgi:hypothetical protein
MGSALHSKTSDARDRPFANIGSGMIRSVVSIGKEEPFPDLGLRACFYSIGYGKVNCKEFHAF